MNEYKYKQLRSNGKKVKYGYELNIFVPMFGHEVTVYYKKVNRLHSEIISDIIRMDDMDLKALKVVLLLHYTIMCGMCDWGSGRGKDNPFNINTPDDAFGKSKLVGIHIYNPERYHTRWCMIEYTPEWEDEHGVCIAIRNGTVHGIAEDYNFPYPNDEQSLYDALKNLSGK